MRRLSIFIFLFFISVAATAAVHRVGCYNIRYPASSDTLDGQRWKDRRDYVAVMIRDTMNYDVVALQEVYNSGYESDLKARLSNTYSFIMGAYYGVELLYRTSRYTCLDKGVYYLAPDPSKSGRAWDAQQTRWTVWAKLKDKTSGEVFVFASTHLDLYPISLREGARVNQEQLLKIAGTKCACLVAGDMNCEQFDHDPHANYGISFGNARQMSKTEPQGSFYTFASGMNPSKASKLIDFLYVRNVEVESYFVNNTTMGRSCKLMPSDHMPLVCEVTILPSNRKTTHVVKNVDELREAVRLVQPNDIIYLREGTYDLGDSTLNVPNTCTIQGDEGAVLTGIDQLISGERFVSLELQGLTFKNASCPIGKEGALVSVIGKYLNMSECLVDHCQTYGNAFVMAKDCGLTMDHCTFTNNTSLEHEGCVYATGEDRFAFAMQNCTFVGNAAYRAPAVYYTGNAAATFEGNSFISNTSKERGAVAVVSTDNKKTISFTNNTFANNRIDVLSSLLDATVGGSAIWQEQNAAGSMKLVGNTIVGNYTASKTAQGACGRKFKSGAVHCKSGLLNLNANIIAGNYSVCAGRGDISAEAASIKSSSQNIYSATDNLSFTPTANDFVAADYATACSQLVGLLGGEVKDNTYVPTIYQYGTETPVWAISPRATTYAGQNIAVVSSSDNPYDQSGTLRNSNTVPGAMEIDAVPTQVRTIQHAECTMQNGKFIKNGQLYIQHNDRVYNSLGF